MKFKANPELIICGNCEKHGYYSLPHSGHSKVFIYKAEADLVLHEILHDYIISDARIKKLQNEVQKSGLLITQDFSQYAQELAGRVAYLNGVGFYTKEEFEATCLNMTYADPWAIILTEDKAQKSIQGGLPNHGS